MLRFSKKILINIVSLVLLAGCGSEPLSTQSQLLLERCTAFLKTDIPEVEISLAQLNNADDELPEHCEIIGAINKRVSSVDKQEYAIGFHLRMPSEWNGRFYYSGGAGTDGRLGDADDVLPMGYAVVSSDSGHNGSNSSPVAGTFQFGFDPQARRDYGYNGPAQVVLRSKALVSTYYPDSIQYSYFMGCSEGGREGLMFSKRYPDYFDGIVAGNPGLDLPKAAIAQAWDTQAFATLVEDKTLFGSLDLGDAFTAELEAVADAVLNVCDVNDGLKDGMVFNPQACDFDLETVGPSGSGKLSSAQVSALQRVFSGAVNSAGESLYSDWFWDPGVGAKGWRMWKIGPLSPLIPGNSGLNVTLGGGALPFIFTTPPNTQTQGTPLHPGETIREANPLGIEALAGFGDAFVPWILSFNMDSDADNIYKKTALYPESAMDFMGTIPADYSEFSQRGSKLILYTGQADPVFSAKYHIAWYQRLVENNAGLDAVRQFARLFLVPGMNHCAGGPSTSQFDALTAVVNWVEKDKAPNKIIATAPDDTPWPGRTRPLCAYPQQARYSGEGNSERAENFTCRLPK